MAVSLFFFTHKYVCAFVMIFCMWYAYNTLSYLVFVHHGLLLNLCFDQCLAYHCITILNTLCLSRLCGEPHSLYSTFRRTSSSLSHKHRMTTSSLFRIAPTPSSEPDVCPVSFRIACFAKLLFGFASRYMYRFPPYSGPPPSNANTAFDGT